MRREGAQELRHTSRGEMRTKQKLIGCWRDTGGVTDRSHAQKMEYRGVEAQEEKKHTKTIFNAGVILELLVLVHLHY